MIFGLIIFFFQIGRRTQHLFRKRRIIVLLRSFQRAVEAVGILGDGLYDVSLRTIGVRSVRVELHRCAHDPDIIIRQFTVSAVFAIGGVLMPAAVYLDPMRIAKPAECDSVALCHAVVQDRRILCRVIGEWVEDGQFPDDMETLKGIVRDISYYNSKRYFGFSEKK